MTELTVLGTDAGDAPALRMPDARRVFAVRSERLAALARGHAAGLFLELLASVARGQHQAARDSRVSPRARLPNGAPIDHARWERDPVWRGMLRVVLAACRGDALPAPAREAIARLEREGEAEIEALADGVLAGPPRDLASAPFVGAALQVYFTLVAAGLDGGAVPAGGAECPVCGSPPVAGVILGAERSRYLACSLCAVEWHFPRVQCFICRSAAKISYFSVEGTSAGATAEACDACRTYLKLFDQLEAPTAEPVADDAATLVLDLLVGGRGYRRAGVNLLSPAGEPGPTPTGSG